MQVLIEWFRGGPEGGDASPDSQPSPDHAFDLWNDATQTLNLPWC